MASPQSPTRTTFASTQRTNRKRRWVVDSDDEADAESSNDNELVALKPVPTSLYRDLSRSPSSAIRSTDAFVLRNPAPLAPDRPTRCDLDQPAPRKRVRRLGRVVIDSDDEDKDDVVVVTSKKLTAPRLEATHIETTTALPISIDLQGSSKFPCFEIRLHDILEGLMELNSTTITIQNHQILHEKIISEWQSQISDVTLEATKCVLSLPKCPSVTQLLGLPRINGDSRPGDYLELILPDRTIMLDPNEPEYAYLGSGTKVGKGLQCRTDEHARPTYRAHEMKKKNCYHYELIDQAGKHRTLHYRKLAVTDFPSKAAKDINDTRALCLVVEQVLSIWLRSFATQVLKRNAAFVRLSPFEDAQYLGANCTPPLKQDSQIVLEDARSLTPEEWDDRHAEQSEQWRQNMTDVQRERTEQYQTMYNQRVHGPRLQMKKNGVAQNVIDDFVQNELNAIHASLPARTKGSNRRRPAGEVRLTTERVDVSKRDEDTLVRPRHKVKSSTPSRTRGKRGSSCQHCRDDKKTCDGQSPCGRCREKGFECQVQKKS